MDRNVLSHLELLKAVCKAKPSARKSLLQTCTCDFIRTIAEIAHNTLKGRVKLTSAQKAKLKKHRAVLHRVAREGESVHKKRKILVQKGGGFFLPALIAPIVGAIASHFISKASS